MLVVGILLREIGDPDTLRFFQMERGNFQDGSGKIVFHRLRGLFWEFKGCPMILKPVILKSAECYFVDKILAQTEGRHDNDFSI